MSAEGASQSNDLICQGAIVLLIEEGKLVYGSVDLDFAGRMEGLTIASAAGNFRLICNKPVRLTRLWWTPLG